MAAWISAGVAVIALVYTAVVDWKRRKLEGRVTEMNAKYLEHQLRTADEEREAEKRADVQARLVREENRYRLRITNAGPAVARNVDVSLDHHEKDSPIIRSDYDAKIPVEVFHPDQEFDLLWAVNKSTGSVFNISLRWTDDAGHQDKVVRVTA